MKPLLAFLTITLILYACSSTNLSDEDAKRKELEKYKQELKELENKIEVLEKELTPANEEEQIKVAVKELNDQKFEHFIEVTGKVEAELDIDVSPETAGVIESIVVKEGQRVEKGEVLGFINTDVLQRNMEELKVQLALAETNFRRQKNLWDQNIGSEMQYLQAKTNKESLEKRMESLQAQIDMSRIKSPVNGVIDFIYLKKGEIGSPQTPLAKVLNIENIKIYADVSETYLTKVKEGDAVKINFPAINKETVARIGQIANIIDPNNRTFRIRINLKNPDKMIKPNLVSIIQIRDYYTENAIVIPSLFIKEDFKGKYTFVIEESQGIPYAKKKYVQTGMTNNNQTEVTDGLTAGMKIISEGYNQVSDGTPVAL